MNLFFHGQTRQPTLNILFTQGFRIFFTMAGIWSVVAMGGWLVILWTGTPLPYFSASWHHAHEMLFGFTACSAAGFLLTATPVWSKTKPLTGFPLKILALLWLLGRLGAMLTHQLPPWFAACSDGLFFIGMLAFVGPTLWFTGNKVHRIFPVVLTLLAIGDLLFHLEAMNATRNTARIGLLLGQNAIIFFLVMTGGHIMPMFTRDALKAKGENILFTISPTLEIASVLTLTLVVLADLFLTDHPQAGWIFLAAGVIQAIRLARWHGLKTLQTPLLWVLHLGYLWLVVGLLLRGLAPLTNLVDNTAALHASSIGAMGLFTLGIMSRVALTHTGRPVQGTSMMIGAFLLMTVGAIIRVFLVGWQPLWAIFLAGSFWIVAYILFCLLFLPILTTPRPDGQPD